MKAKTAVTSPVVAFDRKYAVTVNGRFLESITNDRTHQRALSALKPIARFLDGTPVRVMALTPMNVDFGW